MSSLRRKPDPRKASGEPRPVSDRPQIWADGSQQPKFDLSAYARVSLILSRQGLGPLMAALSEGIGGVGLRMTRGDWRLDVTKLGRAAQLVPSHVRVGAVLATTAAFVAAAKETVLPVPAVPEEPAYPDLFRHRVRPVTATRPVRPKKVPLRVVPKVEPSPSPAPQPAAEPTAEPALTAIRSVMQPDEAEQVVAQPSPTRVTSIGPDSRPARTKGDAKAASGVKRAVFRAAAAGFGWFLIALTLPYGAIQAGILHVSGEDLRDWD